MSLRKYSILQYQEILKFEKIHWWYKGLRYYIKEVIKKYPRKIKILDVGCGMGGNLELLKKLGFKNIYGFDISEEAVNFCHKRGFLNVKKGDIKQIPFKSSQFDFAICSNVFECKGVNKKKAYKELLRILKPKGRLLIILSAIPFIFSEHDVFFNTAKRFTKKSASAILKSKQVLIKKSNYLYFFLFPMVAAIRITKRIIKKGQYLNPHSDFFKLPYLINEILYLLIVLETKLSSLISFPFGTSLIILIQKFSP